MVGEEKISGEVQKGKAEGILKRNGGKEEGRDH